MSLHQLVSNGIALMEGNQQNNVSGVLSDFLQSQGLNMNDFWQPSVDIVETSTTVTVYINVPGIKNNSIDVDFFNNRIIVTGERKKPFSDRTTIVKNEIIYGKFERQIIIPISVTNRESVKISSKNGVLIIVIDKEREARNRFSVQVSPARSEDSE
jgi:HSP20 family protein